MNPHDYIASTLDLFAGARVWKGYLRSQLEPYLRGEVLEVGAGIGGTTRALYTPRAERWVCLEPDAALAGRLSDAIARRELPSACEVRLGTLAEIGNEERFDTILYIDVLEHIQNDRDEVRSASGYLKAGGSLIILSPAHQWLFTPFDKVIGHYRRYTKQMMAELTPPKLELIRLDYLDSAGLLASSGNRYMLHASMPTARQVALWDRVMVRLSRVMDPLLRYSLGKSVLAVWTHRDTGA